MGILSTYFEWKDILVNRVEGAHGDRPREQTGNVAASLLRFLVIVIWKCDVRHHQIYGLACDAVLREVLEVVQEANVSKQLQITR